MPTFGPQAIMPQLTQTVAGHRSDDTPRVGQPFMGGRRFTITKVVLREMRSKSTLRKKRPEPVVKDRSTRLAIPIGGR